MVMRRRGAGGGRLVASESFVSSPWRQWRGRGASVVRVLRLIDKANDSRGGLVDLRAFAREQECHERTVRRDLDLLAELGWRVETIGAGYPCAGWMARIVKARDVASPRRTA